MYGHDTIAKTMLGAWVVWGLSAAVVLHDCAPGRLRSLHAWLSTDPITWCEKMVCAERGAPVDEKCHEDQTALMTASLHCHRALQEILVGAGAKVGGPAPPSLGLERPV